MPSSGHELARSCLNLREHSEKFLLPAHGVLYTSLTAPGLGQPLRIHFCGWRRLQFLQSLKGENPRCGSRQCCPERPGLYPQWHLESMGKTETQDKGEYTRALALMFPLTRKYVLLTVFSLTDLMQKSGSKGNPSRHQSGRTLGLLGPCGA